MTKISPEIKKYLKENSLDELLQEEIDIDLKRGINESVDPTVVKPYRADWIDLVRLHKLIRKRRVTTILEFGCGHSTLIFADALNKNKESYGDFVASELRRNNAFELHVVEDMPFYLDAVSKRIPKHLESNIFFTNSEVRMTTFADRICTEYSLLPNICPDFIYLDGPSQHSAIGDVCGISTRHPDRLPMSCDLLKIEHFLLPGTFVVVDGRTANARFLRSNLQRNWTYRHDKSADVSLFELVEKPLGRYNQAQVSFCLGKRWPRSG